MTIQLEFLESEFSPVSYFSLGNFTFEKEGGSFTSKNRKPDQSCMLLASLPDLFDRLVKVRKGETRKFVFEPIDCSYEILFEKRKEQLIISEFSRQKLICGIDEFARALNVALENLFAMHDFSIRDSGEPTEDFEQSLQIFKETFSL